jgi:flagellar biosynthesis protein FliP
MMLMPLSPPLSWAREGWRAAVRRMLPPLSPTTGLLLAALVCVLVAPEWAQAQAASGNFALDKILPSSMTDKPFLVKVITVLIMMAIAGGVVMIGFGVMGGVGDVFTAVSDARRHGEWGVFIKNVAFIIAVLVVAAVLIALVIDWMNNLTINPNVTIG